MRRLVIAALAGLLLVLPGVASAADFNVTTTADGDDKECAIDCTLREAVVLAGSASDTVRVPKGVYTLTLGELLLVGDDIVGLDGARAVIIDGARETRLMRVADGGSTVVGVTLRRGNPQNNTVSPGFGGAVLVQTGGTLTLSNSTVTDNDAQTGGGILATGPLAVVGSTISGNDASTGRLTRGGGIAASNTLLLWNSTVTGNTAVDTPPGTAAEGGGVWAGGVFQARNATIAGNTSSSGGGLFLQTPQTGTQTVQNSILGANTGGACGGAHLLKNATANNIAADATCAFEGPSDRNSLNPVLGALLNNGGNTDTLALAPNSPAINQGASCLATDQRGVARPQPAGGVCDIGAYEYRAPTLTIVSTVVNDALGSLTPAGMTVNVRQSGAHVKGSPAAGVAAPGLPYTLVAGGSYTVDANAIANYTLSYSADCNVTLAEGDAKTCTVTANDIAPTLRVITNVTNNSGGSAEPDDFDTHVRLGGRDVDGSPQPGSLAGTLYTLQARTYGVSAEGVPGYAASVAGDCTVNGTITLQIGDAKVCTITADDGAATLDVTTQVINNDGGNRSFADVTVHVRSGGQDVTGSPQAGSDAGTPYSVPAGTYAVSGVLPGYVITTSGDCSGAGTVTLALGETRNCTVTANDVAPTLRVVTSVINDSGGALSAPAFTVHVRQGAADVAGSPKPGSTAGTSYTLAAGTYAVGADAVAGYRASVAGACAANGSVTLQVGDVKTCTVTGNDNAIVRQQGLPAPVPGKNVNALPKTGTVKVKLPGTDEFVLLDEGAQIPLGTIVDVRKGRVTIVAAAGGGETADFYGGIFKLTQTKGSKPITVVSLVEKLTCPKKQASASAKKKRKRRLWGDGSGRFRTKGKHSAATVVGTKWLVEDRCASTLTRVVRGRVSVRDFVKKKTVIVRAGKKYVARRRP